MSTEEIIVPPSNEPTPEEIQDAHDAAEKLLDEHQDSYIQGVLDALAWVLDLGDNPLDDL